MLRQLHRAGGRRRGAGDLAADPQRAAHATVFLCGHGGDEVLGGYRISQDRFRLALLHRWRGSPRGAPSRPTRSSPTATTRRRHDARRCGGRGPPTSRDRALPHPPPAAAAAGRRPLRGHRRGARTLRRDRRAALPRDHAGRHAIDRIQEVMIRSFLARTSSRSARLGGDGLLRGAADAAPRPRHRRLRLWAAGRCAHQPLAGARQHQAGLRWWGERHLPPAVLTAPKRTFPYGSIRGLLRDHGPELRELLLGSPAVRRPSRDWRPGSATIRVSSTARARGRSGRCSRCRSGPRPPGCAERERRGGEWSQPPAALPSPPKRTNAASALWMWPTSQPLSAPSTSSRACASPAAQRSFSRCSSSIAWSCSATCAS